MKMGDTDLCRQTREHNHKVALMRLVIPLEVYMKIYSVQAPFQIRLHLFQPHQADQMFAPQRSYASKH